MLSKKYFFSFILISVFLLGSFLRVYQLGEESLWSDESFTWFFTRLPWAEMIDTVRLDGETPPVFYSANKVITDIFGDSEAALRMLSAASGIVTLYIAWLLGKEVGGKIGGFASLWFIGFHPMAIIYARDARPYGLVLGLATAYIYIFLQLRTTKTRRLWISAFILLLLGQLTQYYFFGLGGVLLLVIMSEIKQRPLVFRYWMLVWIGAFLPLAAWLVWYFSQPYPSLGIGWIRTPVIADLVGTWWNLLSGYGGEQSISSSLFGLVAIILFVFSMWSPKERRKNIVFILITIILPVIVVFIISQRRPIYVDRYFIIFLPLIAIQVSIGAQRMMVAIRNFVGDGSNFYILQVAVLVPAIIIGLWVGWPVHVDDKFAREDWRGMVAYLDDYGEENQTIWLSEHEAPVPLSYYYDGDISKVLAGGDPMLCAVPCWWIFRQPYSDTHSFSQAISTPGRPSYPDLPTGCNLLDMWGGTTGVALWYVICEVEEH